MLDSAKTRQYDSGDVRQSYTFKDTILYALGIGFGAEPTQPDQLRYVYEAELAAWPTMAAVLASPGFWLKDQKELGANWVKLVHGAESIRLFAPLPASGTIIGRTRVTHLVDKGADKGALVFVEKTLADAATGDKVAVCERQLFLRGDGGFSNADNPSDVTPVEPKPTPQREPDTVVQLATRPDQALLYRLSGDYNPLHIDPAIAEKAGFPRPILHGLATFGIASRAFVGPDSIRRATQLNAIQTRFAAPVYPGETLSVEIWDEKDDLAFRVRAMERDIIVLSHGRAEVS